MSVSDKQLAIKLEENLQETKNRFSEGFQADIQRLSKARSIKSREEILIKMYRDTVAFFNTAEQSVPDSELLGAHTTEHWVTNKAETCLNILVLAPKMFSVIKEKAKEYELSNELIKSMRPDETAFASMQRMVSRFFPGKANGIRAEWLNSGLPTFGFDNPLEVKQKKTPRYLVITGIVFAAITMAFLMALIIMSVFGLEVGESSRFILVAFLSFGIGLSTTFLGGTAIAEGKIPIPYMKQHTIKFSAAGGVAVIIITMLLGHWLYVAPAIP